MDILRFITAGNVDDGKSTLIGRLLYDTNNLKNDVVDSISDNEIRNLAHITDGLRSEREQGITIDVAYKYFESKNRKYIITDAPGHFQYTKNLVTGASNADAMIILIDAKNGITEQARRHSLVASFLKIRQIVVAINKMDLVSYAEEVFAHIKAEYLKIAGQLGLNGLSFIPMSALHGDNVSFLSGKMPWYSGKTLEQYLESCEPSVPGSKQARFVVQYVSAMNSENLVYGKLVAGRIKHGDAITVLPHNVPGDIMKIWNGYEVADAAEAGQNLCLSINSGKGINRGDIITHDLCKATVGTDIDAMLCWLDTEKPLEIGTKYFLRIGCLETMGKIVEIDYKIDVNSFEKVKDTASVKVNGFAKVKIETADAIVYDAYALLRGTGRGILIDTVTNYTSGAFTILAALNTQTIEAS